MQLINYITISNFKGFGENVHIDFSQPSVLIGPNNSGKTSVLQALAMWNLGIKTWVKEKSGGKSKSRMGTSINRLNITQVPIKEAKFFWQNANIRTGKINTQLKITIGLLYQNRIEECTIIFTYFNAESIYCFPEESSINTPGLLDFASKLEVKILYPMSGIAREEPLIQEGRIDVLIGQGQTSEVLRNICYKIIENDINNNTDDWAKVVDLMQKLFNISLSKPYFNTSQGTVELSYSTAKINAKKGGLDISLSGRGQQEMLLLISYLYTHKGAVLLMDEPDAHLEILRQKQVFSVLKHLAEENQNQLIIATHSEVILDEAADNNLVLMLDAEVINLSDSPQKKAIKSSLKDYGLEHYYKARVCKAVLYIESSTDIEMLRAFAKKINHQALAILDGKLYSYYVQDDNPSGTLDNEIKVSSGYFNKAKRHFQAIKSCVDEFKGIGVFDSDNTGKTDETNADLKLLYWKKYELENYFAYPYVITSFLTTFFNKQRKTPLEIGALNSEIEGAINQVILSELFENNKVDLENYLRLEDGLGKVVFKNLIQNKKASKFLEMCFKEISDRLKMPIVLNKGKFHELIPFLNSQDIDDEIKQKLDVLVEQLR
jgi:AAA15 family ATPase/GTPase